MFKQTVDYFDEKIAGLEKRIAGYDEKLKNGETYQEKYDRSTKNLKNERDKYVKDREEFIAYYFELNEKLNGRAKKPDDGVRVLVSADK